MGELDALKDIFCVAPNSEGRNWDMKWKLADILTIIDCYVKEHPGLNDDTTSCTLCECPCCESETIYDHKVLKWGICANCIQSLEGELREMREEYRLRTNHDSCPG